MNKETLETLGVNHFSDDLLASVGLMRLPIGDDNLPIHVGDTMVLPSGEIIDIIGVGRNFSLREDTVFYRDERNNYSLDEVDPYVLKHYQESSVEAILEEFLLKIRNQGYSKRIVNEYVKKIDEIQKK